MTNLWKLESIQQTFKLEYAPNQELKAKLDKFKQKPTYTQIQIFTELTFKLSTAKNLRSLLQLVEKLASNNRKIKENLPKIRKNLVEKIATKFKIPKKLLAELVEKEI